MRGPALCAPMGQAFLGQFDDAEQVDVEEVLDFIHIRKFCRHHRHHASGIDQDINLSNMIANVCQRRVNRCRIAPPIFTV